SERLERRGRVAEDFVPEWKHGRSPGNATCDFLGELGVILRAKGSARRRADRRRDQIRLGWGRGRVRGSPRAALGIQRLSAQDLLNCCLAVPGLAQRLKDL